MKKYLFVYILTSFLTLFSLFAVEKPDTLKTELLSGTIQLENLEKASYTVFPGAPTRDPIKTSKGFIQVLDEKFISLYTENLNPVWTKTIYSKLKFITVTDNNFTIIVNSKNRLSLLNPSGMELWAQYLSFDVISKPLFSSDSQIIVAGKDKLTLFGINGTQKWEIPAPELASGNIQELNDGSFFVLKQNSDGTKESALIYDFFGNLKTEFSFDTKITDFFTVPNGILTVFQDGNVKLISVKNEHNNNENVFTLWENKISKDGQNVKFILLDKKNCLLFFPKTRNCFLLNLENGKIQSSFETENFSHEKTVFDFLDDKIIIRDDINGSVYLKNGTKIIQFTMPLKTGKYAWNFSYLSENGLIGFFSPDWSVTFLRLITVSNDFNKNKFAAQKRIDLYENKKFDLFPDKTLFSKNNFNLFLDRTLDLSEELIMDSVVYNIEYYKKQKMSEKSQTELNDILYKTEYSLNDLIMITKFLPLFESRYFQNYTASLLEFENDKLIQTNILKNIKYCGYDPDQRILEAIGLIAKQNNSREKELCEASCDAVYEICRFMGLPAFTERGKQILRDFFNPNYDAKIKLYASKTMQKLADLQM